MATEKRLIDGDSFKKEPVFDRCSDSDLYDPYCVGYNDALDRVEEFLDAAHTVDAVEVADMREFAEDVVYQFGYYTQKGGRLHITHCGLSTLEHAFDILGWENPHPVPECECEVDGCHEHATCGVPTADGYKRVCGKHCAKMDGDGNGSYGILNLL